MKVAQLNLKYPMDVGSPVPKIFASGHHLKLFYFANPERGIVDDIVERDPISDRGIGIINFSSCLLFKFGTPNDEILEGHPYFELGLGFYDLFEIQESDWLNQVKEIGKVHQGFTETMYEKYRHFVITFHDNTFECLAKKYEESYSIKSMAEIITDQVKGLIESG